MNILAIDTCFAACSVAGSRTDCSGRAYRAVEFAAMTKGHAEALFPMIDAVFGALSAHYRDFDALAVTIGPGSFTGTRIGIAAVRGLALATGLPVYGATSLAAIAGRAARMRTSGQPMDRRPILVCHDARRDQFYTQTFADLAKPPSTEASVATLDDVMAQIARIPACRLVGTGAARLKDALGRDHGALIFPDDTSEDGLPDAEALLDIHLARLDPPRTLYLRPADAKPQVGKSIARAP